MDNRPEFTGKALDAWAHARGVKLHFIRPGKPNENAYAESFNGRFRDECLAQAVARSKSRRVQISARCPHAV